LADAEHAALPVYQMDVGIHLLIVSLLQLTASLGELTKKWWHKRTIDSATESSTSMAEQLC